MFYIKANEKIVLFDENKERLQNTITLMPQYQGLEILETEREIIELNNEFVFKDEVELELAEERKKAFLQDFFEIPNVVNDKNGYYRKNPKGYSSAVESINSAFNMVSVIGQLPKDTLIFYEEPDFTKPEECTEEWLVEHQFKNETMTPTEFGTFYAKFIEAWNKQEHQ